MLVDATPDGPGRRVSITALTTLRRHHIPVDADADQSEGRCGPGGTARPLSGWSDAPIGGQSAGEQIGQPEAVGLGAVSYTHLTLPTTPYV